MKKTMLWVLTIVLTIVAVFYTRLTGPTVPVRGSVAIAGEEVSYHLIRTFAEPSDATISLDVPNKNITGYFRYRRTPSYDAWAQAPLIRDGDRLLALIPQQPPAGHVAYQITLQSGPETVVITDEPVLIRFRGSVPAWALIPHILLMFATIFTGIRAGLAAFFSDKTRLLTTLTFIFLVAGGLIFGPIVQKFAFGDWWTGWPFGTDLTDNKTAVMFVFWLIALVRVRKNPQERWWVIAATLIMLIAYMIPHSLMGSQIDFREQP